MTLRCRPGDLAVLITSDMPENIGALVTVLELDDSWSRFVGAPCWRLSVPHPLTSGIDGSQTTKCIARDSSLQPIRGDSTDLFAERAHELVGLV